MTSDRDDAKGYDERLNGTPRADGVAQPFARRQVQWGRPPSTVFHAGPLPKGPRRSPLVEAPVRPVPRGGSILSGSMVPRAAAPAKQSVVDVGEPEWIDTPVTMPRAGTPEPAPAPTGSEAVIPAPLMDTTVRPLPRARRETLEALPALPPEEPPVAYPQDPEAAVVQDEMSPSIAPGHSRTGVRSPRGGRSSRLPFYIGGGVAVLALVAGGVWMGTRPDASDAPVAVIVPLVATPTVQAPTLTAPEVDVAGTTTEPAATEAAAIAPVSPIRAAPAIAPASPATASQRPVQASPTRTSPTRIAPIPATPAPTASQPIAAPAITVQPLPVTPQSPPTAATTAPSDPDAPITTRPQPLN